MAVILKKQPLSCSSRSFHCWSHICHVQYILKELDHGLILFSCVGFLDPGFVPVSHCHRSLATLESNTATC